MTDPASIRSNNPGAMWGKGNTIAAKWGATSTESLNDGLGQGNNIAHFPTKVQGAAAQFDLWRQHYTSMTLQAAITRWSGGNWSQPYADFLTKRTGLAMGTEVTAALLASPQGLALMKYQAQWEAGVPYPMTDAEWTQAQGLVFGVKASVPSVPVPTTPAPKPDPIPITIDIKSPPGIAVNITINGKTIGAV